MTDRDFSGHSVEELKDDLEWFEGRGWHKNAETVKEELAQREDMDSSEEMSDGTVEVLAPPSVKYNSIEEWLADLSNKDLKSFGHSVLSEHEDRDMI